MAGHSNDVQPLLYFYNELNLPQSVTFTGGEADYLYLSDGTKLAALKDGSGLIYCGSMVFSCSFSGTAPAVDFESTGFSAGRMVKKDGAVQPEYHVNDYLCSVRVVTDADGEVLERNDYSGYGKRLASSVTLPAGQPLTLWQKSILASARMSTAMTIR